MKLVRRRKAQSESGSENPILAGRGAFGGAFADLAKGKRMWQLMAFGLLGLLIVVVVAFVRLASATRVQPYVVEVDKLGRAVTFGPAEQTGTTDPRIVEATLALFLRNIRTVSSDGVVQQELVKRAYANAAEKAVTYLDAYFRTPDHDPRVLGQSITRSVEINTILAVPSSSVWRAQWTEHERALIVGLDRDTSWEAYLTVHTHRPRSAAIMEDNPLGIYVTDLTWAEVTQSHTTGGVR